MCQSFRAKKKKKRENDSNTLCADAYFFDKGGKNFRCKKYPDTCERTAPNRIVVNYIVLILDRDCMGREENIE